MKKRYVFLAVILCAGLGFFSKHAFSEGQANKPDLVLVPAGVFQMGSNEFANAQPVHEVSLTNDFYIGKYEVTNQQYADILNYSLSKGYLDKDALSEKSKKREAKGVSKSPQKYQDVFDEHSQITFSDGKFKAHPGKENFPVVEVTWYGAAFYCNMLGETEGLNPLYNLDDWSCQVYGKSGYRLPTEAEWEYAASYDDARKYPWGNSEADDLQAVSNSMHNVKNPVDVDTTAVGSFSPKGDSKLGVCDLTGNVAEWCNDWYNDFYAGSPKQTDPVGPGQSLYFNLPVFKEFRAARLIRGGSFLYDPHYRKEMGPPFVMDTVIHAQVYNNRFRSFDYLSRQVQGFRLVKTVTTKNTKPAFSAAQK
ncbi:MAG: SUMF1/EgtB/PvdO family nonheme iron enzyme [Candidatus Omnitrophota bacterium]|jgi:formylglycine-generating enzyme required for sulfatase activity